MKYPTDFAHPNSHFNSPKQKKANFEDEDQNPTSTEASNLKLLDF